MANEPDIVRNYLKERIGEEVAAIRGQIKDSPAAARVKRYVVQRIGEAIKEMRQR